MTPESENLAKTTETSFLNLFALPSAAHKVIIGELAAFKSCMVVGTP